MRCLQDNIFYVCLGLLYIHHLIQSQTVVKVEESDHILIKVSFPQLEHIWDLLLIYFSVLKEY